MSDLTGRVLDSLAHDVFAVSPNHQTLSVGAWLTWCHLSATPNSTSELARRTGATPNTAQARLAELAAWGLAQRSPDGFGFIEGDSTLDAVADKRGLTGLAARIATHHADVRTQWRAGSRKKATDG